MLFFMAGKLKSDSTYIYIQSDNTRRFDQEVMPVVLRHVVLNTASKGTKCRRRQVVAETQKG